MPDSQALGDLLSGAAGAPVNRPGLNAFIANSQAKNGLVSAQTQDAMIKASQEQEKMEAHSRIKQDLLTNGAPESEAQLASDFLVGANNNDPVTALKALSMAKLGYGAPQSQTGGQQMFEGKLAGPVATPNYSQMPPGSPFTDVPVTASPQGAAQTAETNALAGLNTHKNENPQDFKNQVFGNTPPEGIAAITKAVQEGRLDPTRVNSRTAPILAQMELNQPGTNYNRLHADAALQSNATFQQKAMSIDMLPGLLSHVTALGKKLNDGAGYSDLRTVGKMQQFLNGELNDPDYTEYMTARNDTLLRLAGVMRGVGMSDQAHTAEVQAMAPTLAPYALDAWLKGQMSVVTPLLERQNRITHLGEAGQGTRSLAAPTATATPPAAPGLGDTVPTIGGGPALNTSSYPDEQSALRAGHKIGDRVIINGVSGTLQ